MRPFWIHELSAALAASTPCSPSQNRSTNCFRTGHKEDACGPACDDSTVVERTSLSTTTLSAAVPGHDRFEPSKTGPPSTRRAAGPTVDRHSRVDAAIPDPTTHGHVKRNAELDLAATQPHTTAPDHSTHHRSDDHHLRDPHLDRHDHNHRRTVVTDQPGLTTPSGKLLVQMRPAVDPGRSSGS